MRFVTPGMGEVLAHHDLYASDVAFLYVIEIFHNLISTKLKLLEF